MTQAELLAKLRELEARLYSAPVQLFFEGLTSQPPKDQFLARRKMVTRLADSLELIQLTDVLNQLNTLSGEFVTAKKALEAQLNSLNNEIAILNLFGVALGIVAKIVALA